MVAIVWTTKWADFAITVLFIALIFWDASALANMFASQISMLTLRNLFRQRFLFGYIEKGFAISFLLVVRYACT